VHRTIMSIVGHLRPSYTVQFTSDSAGLSSHSVPI